MLGVGASGLLAVTLALFGSFPGASKTAISGEPICRPGSEFWDQENGRCLPCTKCAPEFTLRPCAVHQDALCGPLSALELDWSWLATKRKSQETEGEVTATASKMVWRFPEPNSGRDDVGRETRTSSFQSEEDDDEVFDNNEEEFNPREEARVYPPHERRKPREDDEISWDWQTGALIVAVCACVVFFMVAGCSALVYARQWRRMKRNFEPAGLEEISARLNLMVKAELAELTAGAPMSPGDPETRCQYLEKLLDRKRKTPVVAGWHEEEEGTGVGGGRGGGRGNLYIEESPGSAGKTSSRNKRAQIAQIHRNIESILSHKDIR